MKQGQALVVVVVVLAVVLTIGLSIALRGVTEVNISTGQKEAAAALEAAEAGAERAVGGQLGVGQSSGSVQNGDYSVQNSTLTGVTFAVPYTLDRGDVATVNLNGYTGTGLCIYFGSTSSVEAAVELILYSRNGAAYAANRQGIDPGSHGNGFSGVTSNAGCTLSWAGYSAWTNLTNLGMPAGHLPLLLRIRMLYNSAPQPLTVAGIGANLPAQGNQIISTGRSGDAVQKVLVTSLNGDSPMMFDSAVFSGGGITQ